MIPPLELELLRNFAIALFLGALVGVDRERKASGERTFGGLRTFTLIALSGGVSVWVGHVLALPSLLPIALVGLCGMLAVAAWSTAAEGPGTGGLTSEVAAVLVFLLGAACLAGEPEMAVVLGVATTGLLTFKQPLHTFAGQIAPDDLAAALKLLFATFVVLPLLPTEAVDPWGVLVPSRLWWLVVLISTLSLAGYAAVRLLGERRGLFLTGFFGGLVSSTAVTMASARQSKLAHAGPDALAMSLLAAWAVMCARVLVEVAVVQPSLLPSVGVPMGAMAVAGAAAVGWFATRPRDLAGTATVELRNPFSLWEATKFAGMFAVVLLAVEFGRRSLADQALYVIAALAGTTDVDAITLSMAEAAGRDLDPRVASRAIVLAAVTNTFVKLGIVAATGSRPLAVRTAWATGAIVLAGGLGALLF